MRSRARRNYAGVSLVLCALALGLPRLSLAQEKAETKPADVKPVVKPAPAPGEPYDPLAGVLDRQHFLGAGDVVEIVLERFPDYSRTVRLFRDGTFDYPILGSVEAKGLTVKELESHITEGLRKEFRRPVVHVNLKEIYIPPPKPKEPEPVKVIPKITVLGVVSQKGEIPLPEPKMLRVLLASLGPAASADLTRIRIRYPDGTGRSVDFSKFNEEGSAKDDLLISGGEEIVFLEKPFIPKPDPIRIQVLGEVAKRGPITTETNISIVEALDKVGGATANADLEQIEVEGPAHKEKRIINVEKYYNGDVSANYICQQGDEILVKAKPLKVFVFGEVSKQGEIAIRPDDKLLKIFLNAGPSNNSDSEKVQIIRELAGGKIEKKDYNVRDMMKKNKEDVALRPGDVIFIPHKKIKRGLGYYLSNVASPVFIFRALVPGFGF